MGVGCERSACVVESASHVLSVLQVEVTILKELSFGSSSPTDLLTGLGRTAPVSLYGIIA